MSGEVWIINSLEKLNNFIGALRYRFDEDKYLQIKIHAGKRTAPQNDRVNTLYRIISIKESRPFLEIRRQCKLNYGVPILSRDDNMKAYIFENTVDKFRNYENKLKAMDMFSITSEMSVPQLKEYMQQMEEDFPYLLESSRW